MYTFQRFNEKVQFLFVDEYSLIVLRLFAAMEKRLQQIKDCTDSFGGLFVFFFGYCKQIVPVADRPLFTEGTEGSTTNGLLEYGTLLLHSIDRSFILKCCHRASDIEYVNFLNRLSDGNCSHEDFLKVKSRCFSLISRRVQAHSCTQLKFVVLIQ